MSAAPPALPIDRASAIRSAFAKLRDISESTKFQKSIFFGNLKKRSIFRTDLFPTERNVFPMEYRCWECSLCLPPIFCPRCQPIHRCPCPRTKNVPEILPERRLCCRQVAVAGSPTCAQLSFAGRWQIWFMVSLSRYLLKTWRMPICPDGMPMAAESDFNGVSAFTPTESDMRGLQGLLYQDKPLPASRRERSSLI